MRIALIAPFGLQPKGTVSARLLPFAHALAGRGHMVRVVIPPWDDPSARGGSSTVHVTAAEHGQVAGVHVVTLPQPRGGLRSANHSYGLVRAALRPSGYAHRSMSEAERALGTFAAEVAHVFKPLGYSGLAGMALSALRVPWVLDVDDWEGPGGWVDANRYSPAVKLAITVQETLLPRMAGAVTAASRTLEARAWGFGLPRRRVYYMPNGVWRDKYGSWASARDDKSKLAELKKRHALGDGPIILLYTRFAEFPYAWPLDVLEHVLETQPDAQLLVAGSGFFGEEDKLQAEGASRAMGLRVIAVGRVPEQELPAYLALGDVAIYPMADTLINRAKSPVKVLEPMLMALPIVAHHTGQAAEFLGDAGVLVPPGDVPAMADAVRELLANPHQRETLGRQAQQRVWACFNWERLCVAGEEAYSCLSALSGSNRAARNAG